MTVDITIKEPSMFFCSKDERYFFLWLKSIKAIHSFKGEAKGLTLTVHNPISDESLIDLIALMSRYRLNLNVLSVFYTPDNSSWFKDAKSY